MDLLGLEDPGLTSIMEGASTMKRSAIYLAALAGAVSLLASGSLAHAAPPPRSGPTSHGMGFHGFGARIGLVDPENSSSTIAYGAHIDAGEFVSNVHVMPYIEYWNVGVSGIDTRDFTVATDVNLDFPLQGGSLVPYAGAGLGVHSLHTDVPVAGSPPNGTKLGLNIQGGIRNQAMPNLGIFGELRFSFVDGEDQLKLMGGFTYNFIY